jgi:LacI family transcriptional regulator
MVIGGNFSQESGTLAARRIAALAERPDAVFAANDLMAIGAAQAFRDAGIAIPDEVALVGFDDIPLASLITPALTTLRIDVAQFGRRALERLVRSMEEPDRAHGEMEPVRPALVIRQSCGHGPTSALAGA